MIYESSGKTLFGYVGTATGQVGKQIEPFASTITELAAVDLDLTPQVQLAYELYSASFSEKDADSRFLMLMMAVETLLDRKPRSNESLEVVASLEKLVKDSNLLEEEANSLRGALKDMRLESIGQAGRRVASLLNGSTYQGDSPVIFFRRCYSLRSALVHGNSPRPSVADTGLRAAHLEHFVADLIAVLGGLGDNLAR
ncbi:hypothetical protein FDG2_4135 [Candidatus Protofrankia californiensis]|uniref:Uncharacterized protein n=1 Tax=Candidatus Protofrankia californiensis TaxID=1839754 RepID=A0A1C3P3K6_9ACTN|nr:hypothetical protein FDG2_4135 [Candidatus Protofrankia californiensis]